jgi:pilus assembly protein Flp/PilA
VTTSSKVAPAGKRSNKMESLIRFLKDEDGVTIIEYALMAALFAVLLIGAISTMRDAVAAKFEEISEALG